MDACFPFARDRLHYPLHLVAGLDTHKTGAVLLWGTENPDIVVDIEATIDIKMRALAAHESQLSSDISRIEQFTKRRATDAAKKAADNDYPFQYAEVFRRISFRR